MKFQTNCRRFKIQFCCINFRYSVKDILYARITNVIFYTKFSRQTQIAFKGYFIYERAKELTPVFNPFLCTEPRLTEFIKGVGISGIVYDLLFWICQDYLFLFGVYSTTIRSMNEICSKTIAVLLLLRLLAVHGFLPFKFSITFQSAIDILYIWG